MLSQQKWRKRRVFLPVNAAVELRAAERADRKLPVGRSGGRRDPEDLPARRQGGVGRLVNHAEVLDVLRLCHVLDWRAAVVTGFACKTNRGHRLASQQHSREHYAFPINP